MQTVYVVLQFPDVFDHIQVLQELRADDRQSEGREKRWR
jgi:hypothetical protein